jgi:hypothetical protein
LGGVYLEGGSGDFRSARTYCTDENEWGMKAEAAAVASHMRLVYHIAFSVAFGRHGTGWQITTLFDYGTIGGDRIGINIGHTGLNEAGKATM